MASQVAIFLSVILFIPLALWPNIPCEIALHESSYSEGTENIFTFSLQSIVDYNVFEAGGRELRRDNWMHFRYVILL